jgi:hypothetical protein
VPVLVASICWRKVLRFLTIQLESPVARAYTKEPSMIAIYIFAIALAVMDTFPPPSLVNGRRIAPTLSIRSRRTALVSSRTLGLVPANSTENITSKQP